MDIWLSSKGDNQIGIPEEGWNMPVSVTDREAQGQGGRGEILTLEPPPSFSTPLALMIEVRRNEMKRMKTKWAPKKAAISLSYNPLYGISCGEWLAFSSQF